MSADPAIDLLTTGKTKLEVKCSVAIVGAGAAGIYLGVQLASRGVEVVLLEAGGLVCGTAAEVGFEALFPGDTYRGATEGRAFGLGGTTSRWGGLLIPHSNGDSRDPKNLNRSAWQEILRATTENSDRVMKTLGFAGPPRFVEFAIDKLGLAGTELNAAGFGSQASLFLPARRKNLAFLLKGKSPSRSRLQVYTNAVCCSWRIEEGSESGGTALVELEAKASNGNRLVVTAGRFVLAAGAIECARILLEMNATAARPVVRHSAEVGCSLSDHLSASIADVEETGLDTAVNLFAPRFKGSWMRSFRLLEKDSPASAPRAFAHFIFENTDPGFLLAKQVLGSIQARRWPAVSGAQLVAGVGGLMSLAGARYLRSRLHVPRGTRSHLQLDIEQEPCLDNRVGLADERDRFGRQRAVVNWKIRANDTDNIRATADRILSKWPGTKAGLPGLIPRGIGDASSKPHDSYHPVGTCRMGNDPGAVVDFNLKAWGARNLWVVSTGVLPSAGTANPTFTMLCLAETLAGHLLGGRGTEGLRT
ncbi:MAG: GMC family oxidoreductase [Planctomycetota bacterium]